MKKKYYNGFQVKDILDRTIEDKDLMLEVLKEFAKAKQEDDAEEVIRCKNCKYWWEVNETCIHEKHCDGHLCVISVGPYHYCAYAEKRLNAV